MGLPEKRALREFQTKRFPEFEKQIATILGHAVPIEVNWESMCWEGYSERFDAYWSNGCFLPLIEGLKAVAIDDLGKEGLQAQVKRIVILGEYAHALNVDFDAGTLKLNFAFWNDIGGPGAPDFTERAASVQKLLEKHL